MMSEPNVCYILVIMMSGLNVSIYTGDYDVWTERLLCFSWVVSGVCCVLGGCAKSCPK